jgi:serine/threonine protein kinase
MVSLTPFGQLLIRETIIWYNHRHSNLLPLEGIFQSDNDLGNFFLVSPFLANGTVTEYLKNYPNVERRLLVR